MKNSHSPIPWRTEKRLTTEITIKSADNTTIGGMRCDSYLPGYESDANAALIVLAVNSHQALVDALHECITDPNAHCLAVDTRDALFRRLEAINQTARQALALATK